MRLEQVFLFDKGEVVGSAKLLLSHESGAPNEVIHGHHLCEFAREGKHLVAVYNVQVFHEYEDRPYPYNYRSFEDPPTTLGDINKVEKAFKNVIALDINKTAENRSTFAPVLGSLPQQVSLSCLELHGISKDTLLRTHGTDKYAGGMNADVHGRNAHADGMDTDAHEVDSGAHEVDSGDNEVDPDDDLPDLDACEEDYDDDDNDSDSDDLELDSDAHCVDGVSFISPLYRYKHPCRRPRNHLTSLDTHKLPCNRSNLETNVNLLNYSVRH